ncbi:NIPSNAP family protein [Burkholderia gladioli]|uniref:NIPSNAP family protein n=1 Tax=Burkholderia gladioli (strain BSR3) TaxID=999541 RepID=F2LCC1_BURGS|nr:NIPSNAP family protein [Burkholderia gladioli]AEA60173.1 NIPSNAP family protein [Burkholderia gladioli BSR3]MBW5287263.1 NIPSNAP family protein [Burkholderia gladioli]
MFVEQRTYTLVPGGAAEYLKLYREFGRAPQERILGRMIGCFTAEVGTLNQLVYLWPFETLDERSRRRAALMVDPEFAVFRGKVRHLLVQQENIVLKQEIGAGAPSA